jgi:hypothetical protein
MVRCVKKIAHEKEKAFFQSLSSKNLLISIGENDTIDEIVEK